MEGRTSGPPRWWRALFRCMLGAMLGLTVCTLSGCFAGTAGLIVLAIALTDSTDSVDEPLKVRNVIATRISADLVLVEYELEDDQPGLKELTFRWWPSQLGSCLSGVNPDCQQPVSAGNVFPATEHPDIVLYGETVANDDGAGTCEVSFLSAPTIDLAEANVPQTFRFIWDVEADLERHEDELSNLLQGVDGERPITVYFRVEAEGDMTRGDTTAGPVFAGNATPEFETVEVAGLTGFIEVAVEVLDLKTQDDVILTEATYSFEGSGITTSGPLELNASTLTSFPFPEQRAEPNRLFWDSRGALGTLTGSVTISLTPGDVVTLSDEEGKPCIVPISEGASVERNFPVDNNDDVRIQLVDPQSSPDRAFEIPIRFTVTDLTNDDVLVVFQWARQGQTFPPLVGSLQTPTPDEMNALNEVVLDSAVATSPQLLDERKDLQILSVARTQVSGRVETSDGLTVDQLRIPDLSRKGLVFVPPLQSGARPMTDGNLDRIYVVGLEFRLLDNEGHLLTTRRITGFERDSSVVTLSEDLDGHDVPLGANIAPGTRYELRLGKAPVGLESSSEGLVHTFLWDSTLDIPSDLLDGLVRIRATAFDVQGVVSPEVEVELESNPVTIAQREVVQNPIGMAIGDVTGDGAADVCVPVVGLNGTGVDVFARNGSSDPRPFSPSILIPGGSRPSVAAFASIDKGPEERADLIVADKQLQSTKIFLLSEGEEVRATPDWVLFSQNFQPVTVAVADIDGNSHQDVILLTRSDLHGERVEIFLQDPETGRIGEETPGLADPNTVASKRFLPTAGAISIAAGDLNGDSRNDIAVAGGTSSGIELYLQDENGELGLPDAMPDDRAPNQTVETSAPSSAVVIGDVNGDSRDDLIVTTVRADLSGTVTVFLQAEDAQFPDRAIVRRTEVDPIALKVMDFNGDRLQDLAILNRGSRSITIYLQQAVSTLLFEFEPSVRILTEPAPSAFGVMDFSGDGRLDFSVTHPVSEETVFYRQDPVGSLLPVTDFVTHEVDAPNGVAIADVNSDGRADIVVTNGLDTVQIHLQRASGLNRRTPDITLAVAPDSTNLLDRRPLERSLTVVDLSGDGLNDLIMLTESGQLVVYAQEITGEGTIDGDESDDESLGGVVFHRMAFELQDSPQTFAVDDVDGDGKNDLVVVAVGESTSVVRLYLHDAVRSVLESGGSIPESNSAVQTFKDNPEDVAIGDVDGDGLKDIAVGHLPGDITILLQRREGTGPLLGWDEEDNSEDRFSLRSGLRTKGVKIADLDRDGASEIISVARGFPGVEGATVYIYVPDFVADEVPSAARDIIALDDDARDLGVIDIEGDGNLELVVVNTGETNALTLYSGSAASKLRSFAVDSTPLAVAVGDVNGDGQDDVAVVTENSLELFQAR